jgi:protein-S-isoprenylcysteine O-methyltransferase Ste14
MDAKLIARYAVRETMGLAVMAAALFWSAGKMDWWPAWASLVVMLVWTTSTAIVILRFRPDLLAERLGPRRGAKRWDTVIMSMLGLIQLARCILAGLDQRYGWTGGFSFFSQMIALTICILGYALVVWATAANAFFSQVVRIQTERGQKVVTGGPYRYVRHPAYVGALLFELAVPVLLASWAAFFVGVGSALLLILRTALEDRVLKNELAGYVDYARRVRYRLLPGIW